MPAARSRASAAAGLPAQRASAARRPLRRVAKAASTTAKVAGRSPGGGGRRTQRDQAGVDVGLGPEDPPSDVAGPADLAVPGGLDRGDAVGRAPGRRRQPLGDLGLHEHQRAVQRRAAAPAGAAAPGRRCCRAGWPPAPSAAGRAAPGRAARRRSTTVSRSARSGRRSATVTRQQVGQPRVDLDGDRRGRRPGSSPRVSEPSPGPTSRTTSSGRRSAVRTIRRIVLASCRKFCPSVLVGRSSSCWASSRIAAGPSSPSDCSGGVLRLGPISRTGGEPQPHWPAPAAVVQHLRPGGLLVRARRRSGCRSRRRSAQVLSENW